MRAQLAQDTLSRLKEGQEATVCGKRSKPQLACQSSPATLFWDIKGFGLSFTSYKLAAGMNRLVFVQHSLEI